MSHEEAFILSVGGVKIQIVCDHPALARRLQERYTGFWSTDSDQEPAGVVKVHLPETLSAFAGNKTPEYYQNKLIFSPPGWTGHLDLDLQTAWVKPASRHAVEEIDYFLRVVFGVQVFKAGGLLLHGAGILQEGLGYVFFGPSGAGKTTVSRLSGEGNVLNDDLILLLPKDMGWCVHSTPFSNPSQVTPLPGKWAMLAGLFRLVKDCQVYLEEMTQGSALAELTASVPVIASDPARSLELLNRCQLLFQQTPILRLHFRKDDSFWTVIKNEPKGVFT